MSSETTAPMQVGIKNIKQMLNNGMDRKAIAKHYGVPFAQMAEEVFNHPDLVGIKVKKARKPIQVVDREGEATDSTATPAAEVAEEENASQTTYEAAPDMHADEAAQAEEEPLDEEEEE